MKILTRHYPSTVSLLLIPVGDVQYGSRAFAQDNFERFLRTVTDLASRLGAEPVFCGTGDYIDFMSPSNRIMSRDIYNDSQALLAEATLRKADEFLSIVSPYMNEHTLVLTRGHHYYPVELKDKDEGAMLSDEYIANALGAEYAPAMAYIRLRIGEAPFNALVFHGAKGGGGATVGFVLNKIERMANRYDDLDAVITGHMHRVASAPIPRVIVSEGKIRARNVHLVSAGGFLAGYLPDIETYVETGALPPVALGGSALWLRAEDHGGGPHVYASPILNL